MAYKTSISIGRELRAHLLSTPVADYVNEIYPLVGDDKQLPYIAYMVSGMETPQSKALPVDKANVELAIYAGEYDQACDIAEVVRDNLREVRTEGIAGIAVTNQRDFFSGSAFAKILNLRILTNPL